MDIRLPPGNASITQTVINLVSDDEDEDDLNVHEAYNISASTNEREADLVSDDALEDGENDDTSDAWDVDSLYEDAMQAITDQELELGDIEACTLEEAQKLRKKLRELGPEEFFRMTVEAGTITAKKLLTAFGFKPPSFLDDCTDDNYYALLSIAVSRELEKRLKMDSYNTIDDAVELLRKSKNIMLITGAGISTSLGIPDFRSKDVGLYETLGELGLDDPSDVFNLEIFNDDPSIFYSIAKKILPETTRFSPTHSFIRLLQDKGKLLTNYSQNIDNLEAAAGIQPEKLIQCHGSFATATCQTCKAQVPGEEIFGDIKACRVSFCKACMAALETRKPVMKRKRSSNGALKKKTKRWDVNDESSEDESSYNIPQAGVMKPDITFFGEPLSDAFHHRLTQHDRQKVDLVIVIGTSLKVAPVSEIVPFLAPNIPQMYISREPVKHIDFDIDLLGDCDVVVAELCRRAGWDLKHEMIPEGQRVEVNLVEGYPSRHVFKEEQRGELKEKYVAVKDESMKEEKRSNREQKYAGLKEESKNIVKERRNGKENYAKLEE